MDATDSIDKELADFLAIAARSPGADLKVEGLTVKVTFPKGSARQTIQTIAALKIFVKCHVPRYYRKIQVYQRTTLVYRYERAYLG